MNEITPWIDGGLTYGVSKAWSDGLRLFESNCPDRATTTTNILAGRPDMVISFGGCILRSLQFNTFKIKSNLHCNGYSTNAKLSLFFGCVCKSIIRLPAIAMGKLFDYKGKLKHLSQELNNALPVWKSNQK